MPTASIYDPKTEDDGWEDKNTANILFDFDRRVAEAGSFSLLKSADPMIRIGLRKNGSYECQFNDLQLGIMVSRGSTVIYENQLDKVICTDQRYLMNCNLPTLQTEVIHLSLIHISEPTRRRGISYAVFCLKKKKNED